MDSGSGDEINGGDGDLDKSAHDLQSAERKIDEDVLKSNKGTQEQSAFVGVNLEGMQTMAGTGANVSQLLSSTESSSTPEGDKVGNFVVESAGSSMQSYGFYDRLSDKEKISLLEKQNYLLRDANKDKDFDLSIYKTASELALKSITDASKILFEETTRFSAANKALIKSAEKLDLDEKEFGQLAEIISSKNKEVLNVFLNQLQTRFYGNFAASARLQPAQFQFIETDSPETNRFLPSGAGYRSSFPLQEKERGEFEIDELAGSNQQNDQYGKKREKVEQIEPEETETGGENAERLTPVTKQPSKRKRHNVISDSDDDDVDELEVEEDEDEDPAGPFDYAEEIEDPKDITNQFFDEPNWAINVYDIGVNEFAMLPKRRKQVRESSRQYHMLNTNDLTKLYRGGGTDVGQRKQHPGEIPIFDVNLKINHNRYIPEAEMEYCRQLFLNYALKKTMKFKEENCDQIIHKIFNYLMLKMATSWRPYEGRTHYLFKWGMNRCLFIMNKYGSSVSRQLFASQAIPWINSCFVVAFNSGIDLAPTSLQEEYYLARMLLKCKNTLFNGNPIVRLPAPILQTEEPVELGSDTYTQFYFSDEERRAKIDEVANFNSNRNQTISAEQAVLIKATPMRKIMVDKEKEIVKEPVSKKCKPVAAKSCSAYSTKSKSVGVSDASGFSELKKKVVGKSEKKKNKECEMPSSSKGRNQMGPKKRHDNIVSSGSYDGDDSDESNLSDINDEDKVECDSKSKFA